MNTHPQDPRSRLTRSDDAAGIVNGLAGIGYEVSFRPGSTDASLYCAACDSTSPMERFTDVWATRLEGQSDPDDMVLVVAAQCPVCANGGAVVLGFGPAGSDVDAAIVAHVPDDAMHHLDPA